MHLAPHAGIGNVVKNKGGVATGLWIYNTSMCFITAHLAAHQKNTKDRNANTQRIFENLRLHAKALTAYYMQHATYSLSALGPESY